MDALAPMPGRPAYRETALCPHCTDGACESPCCGGECRQCDGGGEVCAGACGVWPCRCDDECDEDQVLATDCEWPNTGRTS